MNPSPLFHYFERLESTLASCAWVKFVHILRYSVLETDDESFLVYRLRINLVDDGLLEMSERILLTAKTSELETTAYSFHWQDKTQNLIKRWDNAPHFPDLDNFPHHIHANSTEDVIPGEYITALDVIAWINNG